MLECAAYNYNVENYNKEVNKLKKKSKREHKERDKTCQQSICDAPYCVQEMREEMT